VAAIAFLMALQLVAQNEPEKVTRIVDYEVSIAPSDGRIAFISNRDGRFKLYTMNSDSSDLRRLTDDSGTDDNPAWSPDGQWIAYVSDKSGDNELYVVARDGSSNRRLTSHPGADLHPSWSADGRSIVFTTLRNSRGPDEPQLDLYVIDLDGGSERQLASGASFGSWSPNGKSMIYWCMFDGNAEIVLASGGGRLVKRLTNNPAFDGWPSWSPDGRHIVFARERGGDSDIYLVDLAGNERLVAGGPGRKTGPRWSPDAKWIYYSRRSEGEVRIWRVPAPEGG
jgi:TolB protein